MCFIINRTPPKERRHIYFKRMKICLLSKLNGTFDYNLLTLLMTARCASNSRMLNHIPMSWALSATTRLVSQTNFWASKRISTQLFRRAKSGARGKAATKIVMKPNWSTEMKIEWNIYFKKFSVKEISFLEYWFL